MASWTEMILDLDSELWRGLMRDENFKNSQLELSFSLTRPLCDAWRRMVLYFEAEHFPIFDLILTTAQQN